MDRLTALVAIAHLKLRLEILTKYPHLLEAAMTPKLNGVASALAKLQHGLETRAEKLLERVEKAEGRGSAAFAKAHKTLDSAEGAMADVESFISSLEGANGGPTLDDSSQSSNPEHLTVNGVSQG